MPFEIKMTADQVIAKLKALYGTEFTAADIKAFCAMNDITYQTVTRKLQQYKVSKGKWNSNFPVILHIKKDFNPESSTALQIDISLSRAMPCK